MDGMMERKKAVFNWSGGKDSALALYKVLQQSEYEIVSLLTTVNRDNGRSSMHGIPLSLLRKQAESIGLPLYMAELPADGSMPEYENVMKQAIGYFVDKGVTHFIFGDIYLEDIRSYREKQLEPYHIVLVEPLWGCTSEEIMDEFIASGLKTIIVTTNAGILDRTFIGRTIDASFPGLLPPGTDVCGENGEYHTFCYGGGMFRYDVPFILGEPLRIDYPVKMDDGTMKKYGYWFADLQDIPG